MVIFSYSEMNRKGTIFVQLFIWSQNLLLAIYTITFIHQIGEL